MTYDTNSPTDRTYRLFQPRNRRLLLISGGLLLLAVMAIVIIASSRNTTIFPVSINGKIGYISPAGKIVVQPQFADAGRFEEGLAPVLLGNTWGYIDKNGKFAYFPPVRRRRAFLRRACAGRHPRQVRVHRQKGNLRHQPAIPGGRPLFRQPRSGLGQQPVGLHRPRRQVRD